MVVVVVVVVIVVVVVVVVVVVERGLDENAVVAIAAEEKVPTVHRHIRQQ